MNPLDVPLTSVPPDEVVDHLRRLKEYVRNADDPNTKGHDGQTCLRVALVFCNDADGEERIKSLLDRGADPNSPSAFATFQLYMMTAKRTETLDMLIKAGLRLNDVYTVDPALLPTGRMAPLTLLDYALDIETYLNTRNKSFHALVEKHAGPLTGRRRFVADVISILKSHGAVRAAS